MLSIITNSVHNLILKQSSYYYKVKYAKEENTQDNFIILPIMTENLK